MKKKKYLCCVVLIFAAVKYKILTCSDFITCNTAQAVNSEIVDSETINSETINLQAVLEENSMIYVKLGSEVEGAVIEQPEAKESETADKQAEIKKVETAAGQSDIEKNETAAEQAELEISKTAAGQSDMEEGEITAKQAEPEMSEAAVEQAEAEVVNGIASEQSDIEVSEAVTEQIELVTENSEQEYVDCDTPPNNSFKSYMDYRTITDTTSMQYELQKQADTDEYGMRMVDDRYCVAVGSYYSTTVGQAIDIIMQNGNVIPCIVADLKKDIHTDSTHRQNPNGSIVEFLVDTDILNGRIQRTGDISYFDTVWKVKLFSGEIDAIRVYE